MLKKILLGGCAASLLCGALFALPASAQNADTGNLKKQGIAPTAAVKGASPAINAAVADWARPPHDVWNDPVLKPADVLAYVGVKPGDKVADLMPYHMYWSRLLSKSVGPKGSVYTFIPQLGCYPLNPGCESGEITSPSLGYSAKLRPQQTLIGDSRFNGIDEALDTQNSSSYRNLGVVWNVGGKFSVPEQLDVVFSFGHWHSLRTWDYGTPMPEFLKVLYAGIKPGGTLAIADYASEPGKAFTQNEAWHRVDKEAVKAELIAAGFEFAGESNLLANAKDDHTRKVDDEAAQVSKNVDIFILKFKKPANAPKDNRPTKAQLAGWTNMNLRDASAADTAPGKTWINADGSYQEYGVSTGRWFFDASGNFCQWVESPARARGLAACQALAPGKPGEAFTVDVNQAKPEQRVLVKQRLYPAAPPPPLDLPRPGNGDS